MRMLKENFNFYISKKVEISRRKYDELAKS